MIRGSLLSAALAVSLFVLAGCAAGATIPSPVTKVLPANPASKGQPPLAAEGSETAPAGPEITMGEIGLMMVQISGQLGQMTSGQPPPAQTQQMMELLADISIQMSQVAMLAQEGTPELRRRASQGLGRLGAMARDTRTRLPQMSPSQQQEAMRLLLTLAADMGQAMGQMQALGLQPGDAGQKQMATTMEQIEASMNSVASQIELALPSATRIPTNMPGR
ncbi:MAG: hypothetical protein Q8O86_05230 [Dehalococcoidia bacterium]|nr:hypothetical protein [Dehalococcoidia bacterium]